MKQSYLQCLKELKIFRKSCVSCADEKKKKLYFTWIREKTEKISKENDLNNIYENIVKYTLPNYVITQYTYNNAKESVKNIIKANYIFNNGKFTFNNPQISYDDVKMLMRFILFKRGNVIWLDLGFNIGNEFGGMHPVVILKNLDSDVFVLPISSKKPSEFVKIEKDLENGIISLDESNMRKKLNMEIIELTSVNGYKPMLRWARITRMKKCSLLRFNFMGTIGTLDGKYMDEISYKITQEFGSKINK